MARTRTGAQLIDDAYRRADQESATDRHPRTDVLRYVNQGCAELYDLLIEARGRAYYRSATPWTITTTASTSRYTSGFPAAFYRLVAIRCNGSVDSLPLSPMQPQEEAWLRNTSSVAYYPTHYDLQGSSLVLLPEHTAGLTVVVDYIPSFTDLADDTTTFDGINGWEDYAVDFAAHRIATKDKKWALVGALEKDMEKLGRRISKLAPTRDTFRTERVQDVRGARTFGARTFGGGRRW